MTFALIRSLGVGHIVHADEKMAKRFIDLAMSDIAHQYACPVKSLAGYVVSMKMAHDNKHVEEAAVDRLGLSPDARVLEIGYGRGHGIGAALAQVRKGEGVVFGLEKSPYMEAVTRKRFILEEQEQHKLALDRVFDLRHLAYPSAFFDGIFHVDLFYFLLQQSLVDVNRELWRTLKPSGMIVCGMQLSRLKKLQKWGVLTPSQSDPLRYLHSLEPAGFVDVKMEYHPSHGGAEIQLITARRPAESTDTDPEARWRALERDIKKEILRQRLLVGGRTPTQEDLDLLEDRK